ncbi:hypothetical protein MBLNU457_g0474t1 [Dothideomycetes sp. NU457]
MRVTRAQAAAQLHADEAVDPTEFGTEDMKGVAPADAPEADQSQEVDTNTNSEPAAKKERAKKGSRTASGTRGKKAGQQSADEVGLQILEDEPEEPLQEPEKPAKSLRKTKSALQQPGFGADALPIEHDKTEEIAEQGSQTPHQEPAPKARPGSPATSPSRVLQPKSPAMQLLAKEKRGMRSTSNKENMSPLTSAEAPSSPSTNRAVHGRIAEPSLAVTPEHTQSETAPAPVQEPQLVQEEEEPSVPVDHAPEAQLEEVRATQTVAEDPIEALDALEDAIQQVDNSLPKIEDIVSPQKTSSTNPNMTSMPVLNLTPAAKKSPTPLRRDSAIRKSTSARPHPTPNTAAKRTSTVNKRMSQAIDGKTNRKTNKDKSDAEAVRTEKQAVVIPHSKPRPISLSFPTPPPPPKSKPAALPTFKLPGEAIAAKLKAAKEARMKKEEEAPVKKPTFKARPAPKVKEVAAVVRQTNASRARESLMSKSVSGAPPTAAPESSRRTTTVKQSTAASRPSMSASKRLSVAPAKSTAAVVPKPRPQSMIITSRPSLLSNKPRASLSSKPAAPRSSLAPSTTTAGKSTSSTAKGREVFQRAAVEKAELEKAKREKEEAAKKARAEAAERGRIASREWAEKQRKKTVVPPAARKVAAA